MLKYLNARVAVTRSLLLLSIVSIAFTTSSCNLFRTHKKVAVPQLLTPLRTATKDILIQEINRLASVKAIHGRVDIQFEDTSFASVGIAEKYQQVDGNLILQRPGKIYLALTFTIVDIAQMASDGERFAVAVLQGDEKYKRFVKGTNSAVYPRLESADKTNTKNDKKKAEKETVSALSNLRPQHLTDAFLIRSIEPNSGNIYSLSEFFQEEPDTRPQAKKGARVMRGYYLLEELSEPKNGETQVLRRFWFDRVDKIRLGRLQTLDTKGQIITDVSYFNDKPIGSEVTMTLPGRIELTRPQDQYKLSLTYQDPASVELNKEYKPEAFVLQNKWQLPEVDLDAQNNKKVTANH
ncbi:MAG: hypothetical protein DMF69_21565 [Acidobacteria bacterium]|nr:MAG: hypothetical protein DMF69_21565 [Acidobacteriota bacterium]